MCSGMFICTCWWNSVSDVLLCVMVCAYVYIFEVYTCVDVVLMCVYINMNVYICACDIAC